MCRVAARFDTVVKTNSVSPALRITSSDSRLSRPKIRGGASEIPTIVFCRGANDAHRAPDVTVVLDNTDERTFKTQIDDVVTVSNNCGTRVCPFAGRPLVVPR